MADLPDNPIALPPYWISLDTLVDVDRLVGLHEQFCFAVAKSVRNAGGYGAFHSGAAYLSGKLKDYLELPESHPMRQRCRGMTFYEVGLYIGLLNEGIAVSEIISLTVAKGPDIGMKHDANYWRPGENYPLYRFFIDWLDDQKIFETYGRVYGFLNCPYQMEKPHVDMEEEEKPCDFIWIRTSKSKPFFIQPHPTSPKEERNYVDGHVVWFNPGRWHAADQTEHYAFSFRVDGVFQKDFRHRIYELGNSPY